MKKILILSVIWTFLGSNSLLFAQKSGKNLIVQGILADSLGVPLEGGGVFLVRDSQVVALQQTDAKGSFKLETTPLPVTIRLTYVGLQTYEAALSMPIQGNTIDLGVMRLNPIEIGGVTVTADKIPIRINKDTIEFNASAFRTDPNAPAEDLVKKLPGVEVDKNGNVTAQGEQVRKVRVNGKEFFGNDPKVALQNIPQDAIEKVKFYDKKSDATEFTGIDDGSRERTIDITLKADRSNGRFGNISVGAGADSDGELRHVSKGSVNFFSPNRQWSMVGQANNVNRQGFSFEDYANFNAVGNANTGGGGGMRIMMRGENNNSGIPVDFGGSTGFTQTYAAGLNFNQNFSNNPSKKSELSSSMFFNLTDRLTLTKTDRQNFLPTGNFVANSLSDAKNKNLNGRINLAWDQYLDSMHSFKWTANLSRTNTDNGSDNSSENFRNFVTPDSLQTANVRNSATMGESQNLNSTLLFRKKFARRGRTLTATGNFTNTRSDNQTDVSAINNFYFPNRRNDTLQQDDRRINDRTVLNVGAAYSEPLSKRTFLELSYSYQDIFTDAERQLYETRQGITTLNTRLSNRFENNFSYHRSGATYRYNDKTVTASVGLQYQGSTLRSYNATRDTNLKAGFHNFIPSARFQLNPKQGQNIVFDYDAGVTEPNINQLQPIVDNTDPLNISEGNPDLSPEYSHNLRIRANKFNMTTTSGYFSFANIRFVRNRIVNAQWIDERLVRRTRPINIENGGYDASMRFNWSTPLPFDTLRRYRFSVGPNASYGQQINLINDVENLTERTALGFTMGFDQRRSDKFTWGLNGALTYNITHYSVQSSLDQRFFNNSVNADFEYKFTKKLALRSDLNYTFWRGAGFDRDIPLWNGSLAYQFLKGNRGELRLSAVDLLNQNVGISRTADANYIQSQQINSLGRYVFLSFTYAVRPVGKGNAPMMGPGGGPPMRMIRMN